MRRGARRHNKGQGLVEFALVLPIFLALLFMIVVFGRVIWATGSLASAAREGARYAIVHGGTASNPCPVGPAGTRITVVSSARTPFPYPSPSEQSIVEAVQ